MKGLRERTIAVIGESGLGVGRAAMLFRTGQSAMKFADAAETAPIVAARSGDAVGGDS